MKIVVAIDSFKGSLSSLAAACAIKEGALAACPEAEVITSPLADGGEGTAEAITAALGVSLSTLFEKIGAAENTEEKSVPLLCYELLSAKTVQEQDRLYRILLEMDQYKNG